MDDQNETTLTIRLSIALKVRAEEAAKRNDETLSRVIRNALRDYVQANAQPDLLGISGGGRRARKG